MTMKEFAVQAADIVLPLLLTALTTMVGMGIRWMQSKTKNEQLRAIEGRLADSVMMIVKSTSMTVVAALKNAKADGQITDEERNHIKSVALAELKSYLGAKGLKEAMKVLGYKEPAEMDKALDHHIEGAVFNMKLEKAAVSPPAPEVP